MTTSIPTEEIMQNIREFRSSESNFEAIQRELDKTIELAQKAGQQDLVTDLQDIKEKQVPEYQQAKETTGNAWPEFEKFVTQFERTLTDAGKKNNA